MPTPTKIKAKLTTITPFADDVFKLDFEVEKKYTRFKPGQFLHLTLEDFDPTQAYWPESRVFSICSVPKSPTVSVIIIEQLVPEGATAVLIAGGTGISPYVSYLEQGLSEGFDRSVYLAYAVRSPDRLAFEDVMKPLKRSGLVPMRIWSEDGAAAHELVTDTGRLDLDAVVKDVADLPNPHFLLSGPPAMLEAFSRRLKSDHQIDPSKIHIDEWE